jgi:UDP-N-acetylmuramyl pentapeptide phosphotransferase/UDP-N-acetylglucosamine-1-phosphate transferase
MVGHHAGDDRFGLWPVAAGGAGIVGLLSLLVLAGCAGFLPWNFPKARIFLGGTGSGALGYSIAGILMASMVQGRDSAMLLLLPMAAFLVDAGCTLLLRMLKHEKWWMAHSQHSYQVLARRCGSHVRVTMVYAFSRSVAWRSHGFFHSPAVSPWCWA